VFVVGDDDQSIYRFQGANVANMLSFAQLYQKDLLTVVLTQNYRSTQPILDVSKTIIDKNDERLVKQMPGLSKELQSANAKINHLTHTPVLELYNNQHEEMMGITQRIEQLLKDGIAPGKIGVIYKENKYGEELARYFRLKQIPFYSKRHVNILEQPLGRQLVLMLQFLAAEHDTSYGGDEMLFEILHFEWFHAKPIDIARLSVEVAAKQFSEQKTSLRELLYTKAQQPAKDLFSLAIDPALKQASAVIENLIAAVPNNTLQQVFELMIQQAGVLKYVMQHTEKHWLLRILTGLFDFIKEETRRNPMLTLAELVAILELMEEEELPLPLVQINGNDSGVNLLTAHGSKGLEFEYVFFAGCNAGAWEKKRKPGGGYRLPDTLLGTTVSSAQTDAEELRRLFYVALTRAEQHLILSFSRFNMDGKEIEPSMFVAELQDQHGYTPATVVLPSETLDTFRSLQFMEQARPEISAAEEAFVAPLLDKFVMNVTALNNYLKCPLNFYFNNLVRVPSGKSEATEFGSAVHHALQKLFENMQQNNNVFPDKAAFIEDFNWYMHRHRENFTKEQFDRRMEYGHEVLSNYYDTYINQWNKIVAVERNIRNVVVKGVPIKGKLDKLEFNGKQVNVVDYKTGDIDKAKNKLKPPHEKEPNGGDYWRQAVFYKLLVDNYQQKDWQVVSTEFDFIEPDKKKQYQKAKVVITPEDTTTVSEQIVTVWNKIQAREFYTGCGKADCHWCNFVKTNELAIALHEAQEPDAETD
jgi:DNA helicase-2/ATP-dependent DNA helicase PcrA